MGTASNPSEYSERPFWHSAIGLMARVAAAIVILGAFSYSLVDALGWGQPESAVSSSSRSVASNTTLAGTSRGAAPSDPPELLRFTLCSGETVMAALGSGTTYHQYLIELLSETDSVFPADSRISQSHCLKPGTGRDDFY